MTGSSKFRSLAIALGALFVVVACGGGGGGTGETLAADQTFRFGMSNDITSLDPAHVDSAVDITYLNEVFTGLYRFDNSLKIVPSGAASMPTISADGLTWTFALRHDVVFSNGDKVTSADWVWSWTRTLRLNDAYASNLEAIHGSTDVEGGTAKTITGLSAPDAYTLKAQLDAPAGYWLTQLAMPTASEVLDKKVIDAAGDDHWTEQASTYIGSGPFKMTARTPKQSMDFVPVKNWWGGDTGKLTAIHVDIGIDDVSRVKKFESGGYENVGMANNGPGPDDVLRYKNDPVKSKLLNFTTELARQPSASTSSPDRSPPSLGPPQAPTQPTAPTPAWTAAGRSRWPSTAPSSRTSRARTRSPASRRMEARSPRASRATLGMAVTPTRNSTPRRPRPSTRSGTRPAARSRASSTATTPVAATRSVPRTCRHSGSRTSASTSSWSRLTSRRSSVTARRR